MLTSIQVQNTRKVALFLLSPVPLVPTDFTLTSDVRCAKSGEI